MMKFVLYLLTYFFYPFSFLFVRKKKRWAFGSFRCAFNDNAKYQFIYVSENLPDIDAAWLSYSKETIKLVRQKGLRAYYTFSLKGAWFALTSKFWFFNSYTSDIMFCFSGGATCINLWHGVGLKRTEFNITDGVLVKRYVEKTAKEVYFHPESFRRPDYFLSSAPFQTRMFAKAFRISEKQCWEFGYPRNEILLMNENQRTSFIEKYEPAETKLLIEKIANYAKTLVYMPTWRESQRNILENFDLVRLNTILVAKNQLFIFKPHANTKIDKEKFKNLSNIVFLESTIDIYAILPYTNLLITDYSSILYDYILMENKDVVLYLYDFEEYVKDRDFYYPFYENVVGKCVYNFDELLSAIEVDDFSIDKEKKVAIVRKFWGDNLISSAKRITDEVIQSL